jgi:hypothetical protein
VKFSKALLWVSGVIFFGIGVLYTIDPSLLVPISENANATANARTELRSVYGGMELGIGAFFVLCAIRAEMRIAGLWGLTLLSGLTGIVRFGSYFIEGSLESTHVAFGASEIFGLIVGLYALHREHSAGTP